MNKIRILPNLQFFGQGYMWHDGAEWIGKHCGRNHIYLIPELQVLIDAIYFAYGDKLGAGVQVVDDDANLVIRSISIPEDD